MPDPHLYFGFVTTVTLLMLLPGPNVGLIVANSIRYGIGYGLLTVAGTTAAMAVPTRPHRPRPVHPAGRARGMVCLGPLDRRGLPDLSRRPRLVRAAAGARRSRRDTIDAAGDSRAGRPGLADQSENPDVLRGAAAAIHHGQRRRASDAGARAHRSADRAGDRFALVPRRAPVAAAPVRAMGQPAQRRRARGRRTRPRTRPGTALKRTVTMT